MGCLRSGVIVLLTTVLGWVLGYVLAGSLIPVPDWVLNRITQDPRAEIARDLATTAGKVWGGLNGAFLGLLLGIGLAVFLAYRAKRR